MGPMVMSEGPNRTSDGAQTASTQEAGGKLAVLLCGETTQQILRREPYLRERMRSMHRQSVLIQGRQSSESTLSWLLSSLVCRSCLDRDIFVVSLLMTRSKKSSKEAALWDVIPSERSEKRAVSRYVSVSGGERSRARSQFGAVES